MKITVGFGFSPGGATAPLYLLNFNITDLDEIERFAALLNASIALSTFENLANAYLENGKKIFIYVFQQIIIIRVNKKN